MTNEQTRDQKKDQRRGERPSALTMITAAAASAAAFFVITKSGIAGTLVGAAVFSAVYHGASHWLASAVERAAAWWLTRRGHDVTGRGPAAPAESATPEGSSTDEPTALSPAALSPAAPSTAVESTPAAETDDPTIVTAAHGRDRGTAASQVRRAVAAYAPLVLALAALGASGYSVVTGQPIERVIVRERVVEKPVVEERVVVQKETVTVTVAVPSRRDPAGNEIATPASTTSTLPLAPTTTTAGPTTTSTTQPGGAGTTTSTAPPQGGEPTTTVPPSPSPDTGGG